MVRGGSARALVPRVSKEGSARFSASSSCAWSCWRSRSCWFPPPRRSGAVRPRVVRLACRRNTSALSSRRTKRSSLASARARAAAVMASRPVTAFSVPTSSICGPGEALAGAVCRITLAGWSRTFGLRCCTSGVVLGRGLFAATAEPFALRCAGTYPVRYLPGPSTPSRCPPQRSARQPPWPAGASSFTGTPAATPQRRTRCRRSRPRAGGRTSYSSCTPAPDDQGSGGSSDSVRPSARCGRSLTQLRLV